MQETGVTASVVVRGNTSTYMMIEESLIVPNYSLDALVRALDHKADWSVNWVPEEQVASIRTRHINLMLDLPVVQRIILAVRLEA